MGAFASQAAPCDTRRLTEFTGDGMPQSHRSLGCAGGTAPNLTVLLAVLVALALFCGTRATQAQSESEACAERCKRQGQCTLVLDKADSAEVRMACVAESDEDCSGSRACKRKGRCTARNGICVAGSDDDCGPSRDCRKKGRCTAKRGKCVDSSSEEDERDQQEDVDDEAEDGDQDDGDVESEDGDQDDDDEDEDAEGQGKGRSPACVPGQQVACACSGGRKGFQTCTKDGARFSRCDCYLPSAAISNLKAFDEETSEPKREGVEDGDRNVRLGAALNLLNYTSVSLDFEDGESDVDGSQTTFGWGGGGGVNFGVLVSGSVLIGTSFSFSVGSQSLPNADDSDTSTFVGGPHVQLLFSEGTFRPFLGAGLGVGTATISQGDVEATTTLFRFGVATGAYIFVVDAVSFDLAVEFGGATGSGEVQVAEANFDASVGGFTFGLVTGISSWL